MTSFVRAYGRLVVSFVLGILEAVEDNTERAHEVVERIWLHLELGR